MNVEDAERQGLRQRFVFQQMFSPAGAEIAEALAQNISEYAIASLYPYDFTELSPALINLLEEPIVGRNLKQIFSGGFDRFPEVYNNAQVFPLITKSEERWVVKGSQEFLSRLVPIYQAHNADPTSSVTVSVESLMWNLFDTFCQIEYLWCMTEQHQSQLLEVADKQLMVLRAGQQMREVEALLDA